MQLDTTAATLTRSERLLEMLRLDIVRGVHRGGMRLTEEALAERYGVSRTPVREALRLLAQESLLTYAPRLGYTVESINIEEMDDLYAVRIAIEEQSATRIVRGGDFRRVSELLEYWQDPPASAVDGDINLVFADELFHETLAEASGSTVLPPMLKTINRRLHALRIRDFTNPERVRLTFQQHAAILRSLIARDTRLAQAMLRAHIWESHAYVKADFIAGSGGSDGD
jgi:DNA-binding GntR family transcriptional regulator